MFDYEEIARTVRDNKLPLQKIEGGEKEDLLQKLYSITDHDDLLYINVDKNKLKTPRFKVDFKELVRDSRAAELEAGSNSL
ncbi:MAG: hypothetical protein NC115_09300 [Bacteroidales bacterium]|nr:hypothetical protein [Bacteroidales bacterium]